MTQFDAGPGEWSDREWDDPDHKAGPQARRRKMILPPWALLAIVVGIVILLCVGLVLIIRALTSGDGNQTPTPGPTITLQMIPTSTVSLIAPTSYVTPTDTVVLPVGTLVATPPPAGIAPGALVIVEGTGGAGLNLRAEPTTSAKLVGSAREGTVLTVLEGPQEADGYVWWKVRTPNGTEGWGAAKYLVLKPAE
jgi:Bacterial SH3 domain